MIAWDLECREPKSDEEDWVEYKARAGVGLAVVYDFKTQAWEVFFEKDIQSLADMLEKTDVVLGYNSVGFDHVVLDCALGRRVEIKKELDLWEVIKARIGEERWPKGSWTLNGVCERTLGQGKEKIGEHAPALLMAGEMKKVIDYCIKDVKLTVRLWEFMKKYGYVVDPTGKKMELSHSLLS
jgi:DEAD/DEAH box helicase domain-containing protein